MNSLNNVASYIEFAPDLAVVVTLTYTSSAGGTLGMVLVFRPISLMINHQ